MPCHSKSPSKTETCSSAPDSNSREEEGGGKGKDSFLFLPPGGMGAAFEGEKMMNLIAGKDDFREITMGGRIFWLLRTTCLVTRGGGTLNIGFFCEGWKRRGNTKS